MEGTGGARTPRTGSPCPPGSLHGRQPGCCLLFLAFEEKERLEGRRSVHPAASEVLHAVSAEPRAPLPPALPPSLPAAAPPAGREDRAHVSYKDSGRIAGRICTFIATLEAQPTPPCPPIPARSITSAAPAGRGRRGAAGGGSAPGPAAPRRAVGARGAAGVLGLGGGGLWGSETPREPGADPKHSASGGDEALGGPSLCPPLHLYLHRSPEGRREPPPPPSAASTFPCGERGRLAVGQRARGGPSPLPGSHLRGSCRPWRCWKRRCASTSGCNGSLQSCRVMLCRVCPHPGPVGRRG